MGKAWILNVLHKIHDKASMAALSYIEQRLYFYFYYHVFLVFFLKIYFSISPMGNQANRN
jgi:hypothetical protein